jgi:membrane-anchored protein YejM (alkaline phosphatase superfamily)
VIGLISFHNPGRIVPAAKQLASENPLKWAVLTRDHQQRQLGVDRTALPDRSLPDVLIVVVESFRHELVDPQVMPNLSRYAELGIHCRSHFSGGNATNHGMFSLLNGLEAIWYERPVRYSPLLNRVFRQAGYELGFFAGHDDWRKFYMDGYISDEHFDVFETSSPGGLASDRRATQLASDFLNRDETSEQRRPRLALLYLYATHATYNSYVEDQVFQPAADDRFLIPYPQAARPQIWNRYKNSARSVDRLLSAVLRQDRVVVVTGDHGESFLEDGTIGHGIRISAFQNKTPAVLFIPGQPGRVIEAPTSHADLLPTILSATGVPLSDDGVFDGVDLLEASDEILSKRLLVTRNYLRDDVALIGPWTNRADQPFGYRVSVSLRDMHMSALNCIDQRGYQQESVDGDETQVGEALEQWSKSRFGIYLPAETAADQ